MNDSVLAVVSRGTDSPNRSRQFLYLAAPFERKRMYEKVLFPADVQTCLTEKFRLKKSDRKLTFDGSFIPIIKSVIPESDFPVTFEKFFVLKSLNHEQ